MLEVTNSGSWGSVDKWACQGMGTLGCEVFPQGASGTLGFFNSFMTLSDDRQQIWFICKWKKLFLVFVFHIHEPLKPERCPSHTAHRASSDYTLYLDVDSSAEAGGGGTCILSLSCVGDASGLRCGLCAGNVKQKGAQKGPEGKATWTAPPKISASDDVDPMSF